MELSLQNILLLVFAFAFLAFAANANDPDNLQDICVADLNSTVRVNGFVCKAAELQTAQDFVSSVIAKEGNITSKLGSLVNLANVAKFPGLNTFGISMARIDYKANGGLNPPHVHPRASELLYLQEGTLYVGFVTTENKLFATTLNIGNEAAVGIAALTSQNPGTSQVAKATFASIPAIESQVLQTAFQIDDGEVKHLMEVIKLT